MGKETITNSNLQSDELAVNLSLDSFEIDTIGEILNISMGAAATSVSTLLGKQVSITTPTVAIVSAGQLQLSSLEPALGIEIQYSEGLSGNNLMVMKRKDVKTIVNVLLSEEDDSEELNEIHISAMSEIMNQMMGASCTALSGFLGKRINISTPTQFEVAEKIAELSSLSDQPDIVSIKFTLEVEDLLNSEFMTIMPIDFTKELVKNTLNSNDIGDDSPVKEDKPSSDKKAPVKATVVADTTKKEEKKQKPQPVAKAAAEPVSVKPVIFQSFDDESADDQIDEEAKDNFNLILGVPLEVSVEIGRAKMSVKNILDIRQGSIMELDRQAGDPVDVIVNGQLIAKGDIVIIDDNFGVRIVEILSGANIC